MVGEKIPEKRFVQCHHVIRGSTGPKLAKSPGISLQRLINFLRKGLCARYSTELQNKFAARGAQCSNMGKDSEPMHDVTHWFMWVFFSKRVVTASHQQKERNRSERPHTDQAGIRNRVSFQAFLHIHHFRLFIHQLNLVFCCLILLNNLL